EGSFGLFQCCGGGGSRGKKELAKFLLWEERKPAKPVSEADPAIKWLFNKIDQIRAKHPELQVDFVRDSIGLISSVRFYAPNDEVRKDLLGPLEWALEVAAGRPSK
ncbi:MAG: hypothetical protein QXO67_04920, partial [Candidatus Bathyarchaeia archaeon]